MPAPKGSVPAINSEGKGRHRLGEKAIEQSIFISSKEEIRGKVRETACSLREEKHRKGKEKNP